MRPTHLGEAERCAEAACRPHEMHVSVPSVSWRIASVTEARVVLLSTVGQPRATPGVKSGDRHHVPVAQALHGFDGRSRGILNALPLHGSRPVDDQGQVHGRWASRASSLPVTENMT